MELTRYEVIKGARHAEVLHQCNACRQAKEQFRFASYHSSGMARQHMRCSEMKAFRQWRHSRLVGIPAYSGGIGFKSRHTNFCYSLFILSLINHRHSWSVRNVHAISLAAGSAPRSTRFVSGTVPLVSVLDEEASGLPLSVSLHSCSIFTRVLWGMGKGHFSGRSSALTVCDPTVSAQCLVQNNILHVFLCHKKEPRFQHRKHIVC